MAFRNSARDPYARKAGETTSSADQSRSSDSRDQPAEAPARRMAADQPRRFRLRSRTRRATLRTPASNDRRILARARLFPIQNTQVLEPWLPHLEGIIVPVWRKIKKQCEEL